MFLSVTYLPFADPTVVVCWVVECFLRIQPLGVPIQDGLTISSQVLWGRAEDREAGRQYEMVGRLGVVGPGHPPQRHPPPLLR